MSSGTLKRNTDAADPIEMLATPAPATNAGLPTLGRSTALELSPEDRQAKINEILESQAKSVATLNQSLTSRQIDSIRLKGTQGFAMPDGTLHATLDVVIVDWVSVNQYYDTPYNPNVITPAVCAAVNKIPEQLAPLANSPSIQSVGTCAECKKNEFASAANGKGKACTNRRRLLVIPANSADLGTAEMFMVDVPPTSLANFDRYVKNISTTYHAMPYIFSTRLAMSSKFQYSRVEFSVIAPLNENQIIGAYARLADSQDLLLSTVRFS